MHHKQQLSSLTSHGLKSVGHVSSENSTLPNHAETKDSWGPEQHARCEAVRSIGADPTGEDAIVCAARADVVCEFCGPLCLQCAKETFCFDREHKLTAIDALPSRDSHGGVAPRPLFQVVYFQFLCPNCGDVRLALPDSEVSRSGLELACPECAASGQWQYLAHGLTQRELPFYEKFTLPEEEAEERDLKPRLPWDHRGRQRQE